MHSSNVFSTSRWICPGGDGFDARVGVGGIGGIGNDDPVTMTRQRKRTFEGELPRRGIVSVSVHDGGVQVAVRHVLDEKHPDMQMQFFDFYQGILDHLVGDRMMARLSGFFGILAVLMVVVGLHGLLSYFVAQRRSEIGIRMALGASRGRVVAAMLRNSCAMLACGAAGTVLALFATREASTLLFGLKPWDPSTLIGAAVLLAGVTVVACLVPSMRAANVNPIDSLRAE